MVALRAVWERITAEVIRAHSAQMVQYGIQTIGMSFLKKNEVYADAYAQLLSAGVWGGRGVADERIPHYVVLGLKPSKLHLGHVSLFKELAVWMQLGAKPLIVVGSFEQLARNGIVVEEHRGHLARVLGRLVGDTPVTILDDVASAEWPALEAQVSKVLKKKPVAMLRSGGHLPDYLSVRVASLVVTAILSPQLLTGHPREVIFPCGTNELPFVDMARHAAAALKLIPPSTTCREFLRTVDGKKRMSSRNDSVTIFLGDTMDQTATKLRAVVTGGREPVEHRAIGGDIYRCQFFKIAALTLDEYQVPKIVDECLGGKLCHECKGDVVPLINEALRKYS
jgi:tryptophanyl-tRNA synthetase